MAVYYAAAQQRILGRLLKAKQVRHWIREGSREFENQRIIPSLDQILFSIEFFGGRISQGHPGLKVFLTGFLLRPLQLRLGTHNKVLKWLFGRPFDNRPSDPDDYVPEVGQPSADSKAAALRQCFTPSVASVITISAPQVLLSGSPLSLCIGLGIYFGFSGPDHWLQTQHRRIAGMSLSPISSL